MQSLCVGWRESLRSYGLSISGHTVMSSRLYLIKFPLWALYRRDFLVLYQNAYSILNLISDLTITNPLSSAGKNYKSLIDADGELNKSHSIIRWNNSRKEIENTVTILNELIDIRDGYKESIYFFRRKFMYLC